MTYSWNKFLNLFLSYFLPLCRQFWRFQQKCVFLFANTWIIGTVWNRTSWQKHAQICHFRYNFLKLITLIFFLNISSRSKISSFYSDCFPVYILRDHLFHDRSALGLGPIYDVLHYGSPNISCFSISRSTDWRRVASARGL